MTPNYPMGNKTYASGNLTISPALTEIHHDVIHKWMASTFGAWPEWEIIKPQWGDAYLQCRDTDDWAKRGDWQDQLQLILNEMERTAAAGQPMFSYLVEGDIDWQDEIAAARMHVMSSQTDNPIINCHTVKVMCYPDWDSGVKNQYPTIPDDYITSYE